MSEIRYPKYENYSKHNKKKKPGIFARLVFFYKNAKRIFKIANKPNRKDYFPVFKICTIGIVILGTLATFPESGMQPILVYADYADGSGEIAEMTATANIESIEEVPVEKVEEVSVEKVEEVLANIESIEEVKKILALDGNNNDDFGANAAIYGDTIVFGVDVVEQNGEEKMYPKEKQFADLLTKQGKIWE